MRALAFWKRRRENSVSSDASDDEVSKPRDLSTSLPDELLSEIFLYLHCGRFADPEREDLAYQPEPAWVSVSHVCTRWRNVALHCKKLWSLIVCADRRWTTLSVERSSPLPVYLRAEIFPTTPWRSLMELIACVPPERLASVQIWVHKSCLFDPMTYSSWIFKLTNSPTPLLEHFELVTSCDPDGSDEPSGVASNICLCDPWEYLGKSEGSPLRSLVLSGCTFTTMSNLNGSSQLVSLKIEDSINVADDDDDETFLGLQYLLDGLSMSPNLEELVLQGCIPTRGPPVDPTFTRHYISLPRLRYLQIQDDLGGGLNLLSYLRIPTSTYSHIVLQQHDQELVANQVSRLQALDGLFLESSPCPYRVLVMAQSRSEAQVPTDRVGFRTMLRSISSEDPGKVVDFDFTIQFRTNTTSVVTDLLLAILAALSPQMSSIDTLMVGIRPAIFDCVRHFSSWENIRRLDVWGTAAANAFFDAWHTRAEHILRNVTSLLIVRADLEEEENVERLVHAIAQRQLVSSCAKLDLLVLSTPLVFPRTVQILEEILRIENRNAICVRHWDHDEDVDLIEEEDKRGDVLWF